MTDVDDKTDAETTGAGITITEDAPTPTPEVGDGSGGRRRWRIERRLQTPWWLDLGGIFAGLGMAVLTSALLIAAAGSDVLDSYRALYDGAFGNRASAVETLVQATPVMRVDHGEMTSEERAERANAIRRFRSSTKRILPMGDGR